MEASMQVQIQKIQMAIGGWKYANTRGYYRASLVDSRYPCHKKNQTGYLKTVWKSQQVTWDYEGGGYGYLAAEEECRIQGAAVAAEYGIEVVGNLD